MRSPAIVADSADVHASAVVGSGTSIWDLATVREEAHIGDDCVLGRGSYVGAGVHIADRVKIQDAALVYEPSVIEDGVFIGPGVVLTNDRRPRAVNPDGSRKSADDWEAVGVRVMSGASIGARAVCVAPLTVGRWAMVAAGSVVTKDVLDYALVAGCPAQRIGWVGRSGAQLVSVSDGLWRCSETEETYTETGDGLALDAVQSDTIR